MSKTSPFSEWLVHTSTALGYRTNTSLAKALDVPQPTVSRWKSGSKPGVEHLVRLSELFGVELKTLLVLAGYMKGDVGQDVQPPLGQAERMIKETKLTRDQKAALHQFWHNRLEEEQERLAGMVTFAEKAAAEGVTAQDFERTMVAQTKVAKHLSDFSSLFLATIPEELRFDYASGAVDPGTGWIRPSEDVGKPLPESFTLQLSAPNSQSERPSSRVVLMSSTGVPLAWTAPYVSQQEALLAGMLLLAKTHSEFATMGGVGNAPEEEDES